jgi:NAD+ synthase
MKMMTVFQATSNETAAQKVTHDPKSPLSPAVFALDLEAETKRIGEFLLASLRSSKKRGYVVAVSGGIDSSVCAALAAKACGKNRVFALLLPEKESSDGSTARGKALCEAFDIPYELQSISPALEGIGCYRQRDAAISRLIPDYKPGWRHKIIVSPATDDTIAHFKLVVETDKGEIRSVRMPADVYLQVVAATNFKQRIRKNLEYFHADRLHYAVLGTPNKLEYDLGFFVRGGDGLADVKPIAHLYKSQVYALAAHLGVPEEIRNQTPSTDTYSLPQTQEEFYFSLPYQGADVALYALENGVSADELSRAISVTPHQAEEIFRDFQGKRLVADRALAEASVLK